MRSFSIPLKAIKNIFEKMSEKSQELNPKNPKIKPKTSQWIEIIEPKSKVQMFANLITGECRWDEPKGQDIEISRASNPHVQQWWELFDTNSQRFYYYCAKDSKTVWKRPHSHNSIVVPLAKLQILKQNTTQVSSSSTVVCDKCDASTQTQPNVMSRATQTTSTSTTTNIENNFRGNPSLKHYLISEARFAKGMQTNNREFNRNRDLYYDNDSNDDEDDDELDDESDLSCDADDEYDCDEYNTYEDEFSEDDNDVDDDSDEPDMRPVVHQRYDQNVRQQPLEQHMFITSSSSATAAQQSTSQLTTQSLIPTKSHSLTQISINNNNNNSINTNSTKRTAQTTHTLTLSRPQTPPNRQVSQLLSLVPTTQSMTVTTTTTSTRPQQTTTTSTDKTSLLSIESFAKENIERHRKRGLFIGRKISLKSMLEWSKKSIRKPMISSISDQKLRQESKQMFKFVQKFMKDLQTTEQHNNTTTTTSTHDVNVDDDTEVAFYLLSVCCQQPILRDELLVQIARQTTNNPNPDSEARGLRLMCCCFWYFPPSNKLAPHLNAFLTSHANGFARECVKRKFEQQLRRSQQSHVVYVRKPHDLEEVSRVLRCISRGFVGVFGELLSDAVIGQNGQQKRLIPWPIVFLTESLLKCRCHGDGGDREGVFRCVGDLDEVATLKMQNTVIINQSNCDLNDDINSVQICDDIHVIASGLKLYFRELKEPLIPFDLYYEALDCAHAPERAAQLITTRLSIIHRLSLAYLIRFLQVFSAEEHVRQTKMDDANLSMVWAPNILRAPRDSRDPSGQHVQTMSANVFEQTRSEMSFVRTLIQSFDTSFMAGIQ